MQRQTGRLWLDFHCLSNSPTYKCCSAVLCQAGAHAVAMPVRVNPVESFKADKRLCCKDDEAKALSGIRQRRHP